MSDVAYITNAAATLTFTAGSKTVTVTGTNPILEGVLRGDRAVEPNGVELAIDVVAAGTLTLLRNAPTSGTVQFDVAPVSRLRTSLAANAEVTREVYARQQAAAEDNRSIPVISLATAPPGSPADGDRHLVIATATGAFAGKEGYIAQYDAANARWIFIAPIAGMKVTVDGAPSVYIYTGSAWVSIGRTVDGDFDLESGRVRITDLDAAPPETAALDASVGEGPIYVLYKRTGGFGPYGTVLINATATAALPAGQFEIGFASWQSHRNQTGGQTFGGWTGANTPSNSEGDTYSGGGVISHEVNVGNRWADFGRLSDVGATRYTAGLQVVPDVVPEQGRAYDLTTYPGSFGTVVGPSVHGHRWWTGYLQRTDTLVATGWAFLLKGGSTAPNAPDAVQKIEGYWTNGFDFSAATVSGPIILPGTDHDIGTSSARLRKLWASDVNLSGNLHMGNTTYKVDVRQTSAASVARFDGGDGQSMSVLFGANNGGTAQVYQYGVTQSGHPWAAGFYIYSNSQARLEWRLDAATGFTGFGGVTSPAAMVDVNGTHALRQGSLSLVNGANQNAAKPAFSSVNISGPTAAFNIGGFTGGVNGSLLEIVNTTSHLMTLNHEDASSTAGNRITCPAGANINCRTVTLRYNATASRWVVVSYSI